MKKRGFSFGVSLNTRPGIPISLELATEKDGVQSRPIVAEDATEGYFFPGFVEITTDIRAKNRYILSLYDQNHGWSNNLLNGLGYYNFLDLDQFPALFHFVNPSLSHKQVVFLRSKMPSVPWGLYERNEK